MVQVKLLLPVNGQKTGLARPLLVTKIGPTCGLDMVCLISRHSMKLYASQPMKFFVSIGLLALFLHYMHAFFIQMSQS